MKLKSIIIGQSGGPTTVINASLQGIIEAALSNPNIEHIYGALNGIEGILNKNIIDFRNEDLDNIQLLKNTPSSILGSVRFKLNDYTIDENVYKEIVCVLKDYNIGYFFYIGGNDSMDTVDKLSKYTVSHNIDIKIVGVPKTIDNDLVGIDHSPGFGSAAKYIALAVKNVAYDTSIYSIKSVHIIEAMGRNAGWLTAASALARDGDSVAPHLIYLPEIPFSVDKFVDDVKGKLDEYNSVIVVVSEGIKDENGEYISARGDKVDKFGHVMLSGTGAYLKSVVEERIGCKVRALEPSVLQRSAGHTASMTDVTEAYNLGVVAVKAALDGKTGVFSTLRRISDLPYTVDYYTEQVSVVANNEKLVPRSWINEQGNDVTNKMIEYLSPLVKGVPQVPYRNGLPDYIGLSHLDVKKQKYSD